MRIEGHGLSIELPRGWDGRIFRLEGGEPTLHAANYPLPEEDGEFGPVAVARMPEGGVFLAVTEYRAALAGKGLFKPRGLPRLLAPADLSERAVNGGGPGQVGVQRFCTVEGRAVCLYVAGRGRSGEVSAHANVVLGTVSVARQQETRAAGRGRA